MTDLNAEYFKLMGWAIKDHPFGGQCWWSPVDDYIACPLDSPPNVAGDWQVFHEYVVSELKKLGKPGIRDKFLAVISTEFYYEYKTPEAALRWATEEIRNGGK